ncbi:MAG: tryptophan synthase alpha chain [Chloroflexota bacterium]|nr:tryptophan synthase alpha chain [Chloroflexota bacterium]
MNRIDETFARLRANDQMGLFPYLTAGFPDLDATEPLAIAAIEAGADGLELGVPFSDPLADGATMQHASEIALRNGASLSWTIELTRRLRARTNAPLNLMTYYNPVFHYGVERFVEDALAAGADSVIVPDLPSGEANELLAIAVPRGLYVIQMVAPTSTAARLTEVGRLARGFVYCVSLLGTTGARSAVSDRVGTFMAEVRSHVSQPLLIGFGISRPEHVRAVRPFADAVVVGSAVADLLDATPAASRETVLRRYMEELREACDVPQVRAKR